MALLGFKIRFVPMIRRGEKRHTIRERRRIAIKVGEMLHLYGAPRSPAMRLIFRAPCREIEDIWIGEDGAILRINGAVLAGDEKEQLARRDGFADYREMMDFWRGRLPFSGQIIHWDYSKRVAK